MSAFGDIAEMGFDSATFVLDDPVTVKAQDGRFSDYTTGGLWFDNGIKFDDYMEVINHKKAVKLKRGDIMIDDLVVYENVEYKIVGEKPDSFVTSTYFLR